MILFCFAIFDVINGIKEGNTNSTLLSKPLKRITGIQEPERLKK